jgi:hypothetical protein
MMKLIWRYRELLAIAVLLAVIWFLFQWGTTQKNRAVQAEIGRDAAIKDFRNISTKYVNAQGDVVTMSRAISLDRANFKKALESNDLAWIKKFKNYKNTQSASSFDSFFAPEDKIVRDTVYIPCKDSIRAFKYLYKDSYNHIEATVLDSPKIEIRDRYYLLVTRNRPKNWFIKFQWSRWEFTGQVTNLNRLIKVDSVNTILVTKWCRPRF